MEALAETGAADIFYGVAPLYWRAVHYDVVHFQWPETAFAWHVPTETEFAAFRAILSQRKGKGTRIVTTVHNAEAHETFGPMGGRVMRAVYDATDSFVHMTEFSRTLLVAERPHQNHVVIPHGDYSYYRKLPQDDTALRKARGKSRDRLLLVFGALRTVAEEELAREAFYAAAPENTSLVFAGAPLAATLPEGVPQQWKKRRDPGIVRLHTRVPDVQVRSLVEASRFLFLPRTGRLNSGVIALAFTFGRPVIAPDDAVTADISYLGLPLYKAGDVASAASAIDAAFSMSAGEYRALRDRIVGYRDRVMDWSAIARAHLAVYGASLPPAALRRSWYGALFRRRRG